jgi:hypothetical protein
MLDAPGPLILTSAVIGFVGTVIFSVAVLVLNHHFLPPIIPTWAHLGKLSWYIMLLVCVAYGALALAYLYLIPGSS